MKTTLIVISTRITDKEEVYTFCPEHFAELPYTNEFFFATNEAEFNITNERPSPNQLCVCCGLRLT